MSYASIYHLLRNLMLQVDPLPHDFFKIGLFGGRHVGKTHLISKLTSCLEDTEQIETQTVRKTILQLEGKQYQLVYYDFSAIKANMAEEITKKQKIDLALFMFKDNNSFTELFQFLETIGKVTTQKQLLQIEQNLRDLKHVLFIYNNYGETSNVQVDQQFDILRNQIKKISDKISVKGLMWKKQDKNADQIKKQILELNFQEFIEDYNSIENIKGTEILNNQIKTQSYQDNLFQASSLNQKQQCSLPAVGVMYESYENSIKIVNNIEFDQNDENQYGQIAIQLVKKVQSQFQVAEKESPKQCKFVEEIYEENIQYSPIQSQKTLVQFKILQPFQFKPQNIILVTQQFQIQTNQQSYLITENVQNRISNQGQYLQIPKLHEQLTNNTTHKQIKQETEKHQDCKNHSQDVKHTQTVKQQQKGGSNKSLKRQSEAIVDLFSEWRVTSKEDQQIDRQVQEYWEEKKRILEQSEASHSDQMQQKIANEQYNLNQQGNQTNETKEVTQKQENKIKKQIMRRPQSNISRTSRNGKQKRAGEQNPCLCEIM